MSAQTSQIAFVQTSLSLIAFRLAEVAQALEQVRRFGYALLRRCDSRWSTNLRLRAPRRAGGAGQLPYKGFKTRRDLTYEP